MKILSHLFFTILHLDINNLNKFIYSIFQSQVVNINFSRVSKSLIGTCSNSGGIALVDSYASKVLHSIPSAHAAPVSTIAFSPLNALLFVSVGYDKKLVFYNVNTKKLVKSVKCEDPLSSCCFLNDGQLVVIGTVTGSVLIYDLRKLSSPVNLKAHSSSVAATIVQPHSKNVIEKNKNSSNKVSKDSHTSDSKSSDGKNSEEKKTKSSTENSSELTPKVCKSSQNHLELLSPIRPNVTSPVSSITKVSFSIF